MWSVVTDTSFDRWVVPDRRVVERVRTLWPVLILAGILMIAGFVTGFLLHTPEKATQSAADASQPYLFDDPNALELAANNILVAAVLIAGGISLGAFSVSGMIYNGFLFGTATKTILASGATPTYVVVGLLPHGILEVPILLLAAALGLSHAVAACRYLLGRRETPATVEELQTTSQLFVLSAVGLLVAAVVELHVTARLL